MIEEIPNFVSWWMEVSYESPLSIVTACDLQMAVLCVKRNIEKEYIQSMYGSIKYDDVDKNTFISCHPMTYENVCNYYSFMKCD